MANEIVSVIIPVFNAEKWLDECLQSVMCLTYRPLEVSMFNDASTDTSWSIVEHYKAQMDELKIQLILTCSSRETPGGVGYAKNQAIHASSGMYLCFLDADDTLVPHRIETQLAIAQSCDSACIVGSNFTRDPPGSTWHYTAWANELTEEQLWLQQYRECTVIMPTWFMSRHTFDQVLGGFSEESSSKPNSPVPEDLIFFHQHLDLGGVLRKSSQALIVYRHHGFNISRNISRRVLLRTRLLAFQKRVIRDWKHFTIWGAGRDGKNFYMDLSSENKTKVTAFCDVDPRKIGTMYPCRDTKRKIPIVHFSKATSPVVCCVALGRTNGAFEANVESLGLSEGQDLWFFI